MATDYWASSHHKKWVTDRLTLHVARMEDLRFIAPEYLAFLNIFFANLITKIGKKLHFRQRVIATATVFFKRFYLKNNLCDTEPYIVLVACCYVAGKAEELPTHIKTVIQVANLIFNELGVWSGPLDNHRLAEMEFYLVDELECNLTIFHPYRSLLALCGKESDNASQSAAASSTALPSGITGPADAVEAGEVGAGVEGGERYWGTNVGKLILDEKTLQLAWLIINDTYRTDVCLLYPPFLIAVAAIYLALVNHDSVSQPHEHEQMIRTPQPGSSSVGPTPTSHAGPTPMATPTPATNTTVETPATISTAMGISSSRPVRPGPDPITFLANLNVSMATVANIAQEMLSFYTLSSRYLDDLGGAGTGGGNGSVRKEDQKIGLPTDGNGLESFMMDIDGVQNQTPNRPHFYHSSSAPVEKVRAKNLVELLSVMRWNKEKERDKEKEVENAAPMSAGGSVQAASPVSQITGGKANAAARSNQPVNKRLERAQAAG